MMMSTVRDELLALAKRLEMPQPWPLERITATSEIRALAARISQPRAAVDAEAVPATHVPVPRELIERAHSVVAGVCQDAHDRARQVCCGKTQGLECCGNPEVEWDKSDEVLMNELGPIVNALGEVLAAAPPAVAQGGWQPIETAPRDGTLIEVYAVEPHQDRLPKNIPPLPPMVSLCEWHPDAGFCVCEVREPTHWRPFTPPNEEN